MQKPIFEYRRPTNNELATIITQERKNRGWTQETLAELANVTSRTIQRIEKGDHSSVDSRICIARAFELDQDIFNKEMYLPNIENIKEEQERIKRETSVLALSLTSTGKQLREWSETGDAFSLIHLRDLTEAAEKKSAELEDFLKEYMDCKDLYSASQKIDVNIILQEMIDDLKKEGFLIGAVNRRMLYNGNYTLVCVQVVIGQIDEFPKAIRVPNKMPIHF